MGTSNEIDGQDEMTLLKRVMKTGTLPPSQKLKKYFQPDHAAHLRPLALELEIAILKERNRPYTRLGIHDFFAARFIEHKAHNAALLQITDIRYKIQMEAHRILRSEYGVNIPRPARLPEHLEETTQRQSCRKWKNRHL